MYIKNIKNIKFNSQFPKFILKKDVYEKFEEFLSKLIWRENLFTFIY